MSNLASPPNRKGRGCLFYLGLAFAVLVLIGCLLAFLTFRFVKGQLVAYTDASPMTLPKVEMADAEFERLDRRVTTFGSALQQGKPAEQLILTEHDINALLTRKPEMKQLADKVYVSLNDDQVKGQVSMPLGGLGWIAKDRYLNGEAGFNVSLENGVLIVTAKEVSVKGKPLPESFMSKLRHENLAKDAYKDPKHAELIRKLDRIEVKDGRMFITPRSGK